MDMENGLLVINKFDRKANLLTRDEFVVGLEIAQQKYCEVDNEIADFFSNKPRVSDREDMISQAIHKALIEKFKRDPSIQFDPNGSFYVTNETILAFEPWYCEYTKKPKSNLEEEYRKRTEFEKEHPGFLDKLRADFEEGFITSSDILGPLGKGQTEIQNPGSRVAYIVSTDKDDTAKEH